MPRSALRGDHQLLIVDEEQRLWSRDVEVVRVEREAVIIGEGLEDGESVCVSPLDVMVDGMHVRTVLASELVEQTAVASESPVAAPIEKSPETPVPETSVPETRAAFESTPTVKRGVATPSESSRLLAMTLSSRGEETLLEVSVDGDFRYLTSRLTAPERFVIDLLDVVKANPRSMVALGDGPIERVRIGQYQQAPTPISRLVFDLRRAASPVIEQDETGLIVSF